MTFPRVLREIHVKARKPHRCDSCMKSIDKGTPYFSQVCIDGDIYTWKAHLDCRRASEIVHDGIPLGPEPPNVTDFDNEDRAAVFSNDPKLAQRLWPEKDFASLPLRPKWIPVLDPRLKDPETGRSIDP